MGNTFGNTLRTFTLRTHWLITKFLWKGYCNYVNCVVSGLCSLGPNRFRKMLGLGRGSKQASKHPRREMYHMEHE
jgi:hypothetical protein